MSMSLTTYLLTSHIYFLTFSCAFTNVAHMRESMLQVVSTSPNSIVSSYKYPRACGVPIRVHTLTLDDSHNPVAHSPSQEPFKLWTVKSSNFSLSKAEVHCWVWYRDSSITVQPGFLDLRQASRRYAVTTISILSVHDHVISKVLSLVLRLVQFGLVSRGNYLDFTAARWYR